jgi:hypothetical protein
MSTQLINAWWLTFAMLCAGAAQAQQTVWRCGPGGTSYSNQPCPEGRAVGVADNRANNDVQAARDVAGRDRALAKDMRQERLQREADQRAQGSGLGGFSAAKPVPPAVEKAGAKTKSKIKSKIKSKTKRKPPQPAADQTSTKAARASRRAQG